MFKVGNYIVDTCYYDGAAVVCWINSISMGIRFLDDITTEYVFLVDNGWILV